MATCVYAHLYANVCKRWTVCVCSLQKSRTILPRSIDGPSQMHVHDAQGLPHRQTIQHLHDVDMAARAPELVHHFDLEGGMGLRASVCLCQGAGVLVLSGARSCACTLRNQ